MLGIYLIERRHWSRRAVKSVAISAEPALPRAGSADRRLRLIITGTLGAM
jgi:hypothetical protein